MKKFERTDDHIRNMTMDAIMGNVEMDLEIEIRYSGSKLKAYSRKLNCYLQFPRKLREYGTVYICDATEAQNNGRKFYRAYKGTIRDKQGEVIA